MRPPEEVKKKIVRQWLAKAEQDMKACETLRSADPSSPYPACFHAQQAAEKYLKALLTWHQVEFSKTHAIERLLDMLKKPDPDTAFALADAAMLTPYGVDIRYPGDQPDPDIEEVHEASALARKVKKIVSDRLKENR